MGVGENFSKNMESIIIYPIKIIINIVFNV